MVTCQRWFLGKSAGLEERVERRSSANLTGVFSLRVVTVIVATSFTRFTDQPESGFMNFGALAM